MIKVLHPGFYSTIQDLGRKEYQHLGVPISGAMDLHASIMANGIVGNDANCAVLEMTMIGPKLEFTCNTTVAISGGKFSPMLNGEEVDNNLVINIYKGDILSFGKTMNGFRSYLAVSGGFQSKKFLKSRSMYQGITQNSCLSKGDFLEIKSRIQFSKKHSSVRYKCDYINNQVVKVFKGPEFDKLNKQQVKTLFNEEFTISKENNRMAYQFEELVTNDLNDIITSLVLPGTVQLTPSGKLIILMKDCQTTGGYPRVLQLSEKSINVLAQKFTGIKISFSLIDQNV